MPYRFECDQQMNWPPLAWIARCRAGDPVVRVRHGAQVEVRPEWLCEAIWDGPFAQGDFDRTDLVFGSGIRLRDDGVVFVSAGSTVDRLHVLSGDGEVLVSNSLACLLAVGDVTVDEAYPDWFGLFVSVKRGIDAYERRLPMRGGAHVELVYFRNLFWDGRALVERDKPSPLRDFGTFAGYHGFLTAAVQRLAGNMADPARGHRYRMLGTLSSGYDASTTAVLCHGAGMTQAISSRQARGGGGADDGRAVADRLGLELLLFDRAAWQDKELPELPFLAGNPRGGEVFLSGAEDLLRGRVLVTGFHGDKVWGKETKALGPDVVRGDMSGLSLCEYRLGLGFIHFPPAFMGVRQIGDVNRLSNSAELAPWDVPGEYSRPICRRIVEDAGVPRGAFGTRKKMASVHFGQGEARLTERSRAAYYDWLRSRREAWRGTDVPPPRPPGRLLVALRRRHYLLARLVRTVGRPLPSTARAWIDRQLGAALVTLNRRINMHPYLFPWAVATVARRYASRNERDGADCS
jgi:hypothetical protein